MIYFDRNNSARTIICVGGPSGIGKTTLISKMIERYSGKLDKVVSVTTRPPRPNEIEGVDYHFLTKEYFLKKDSDLEFAETTFIHDNLYGSYRKDYNGALDLIVPVDYLSYIQIAAMFPQETVGVWLIPSNFEDMVDTFTKRCENDPNMTLDKIQSRKSFMLKEVLYQKRVPYTIQVDPLNYDKALEDLDCLYKVSKMRSFNFSAQIA